MEFQPAIELTNPHNLTGKSLLHVLKKDIVTVYFYEDIVFICKSVSEANIWGKEILHGAK